MLDRQAEIPLYSFSVWVSPVAVFCAGIAMNRDAIAMDEMSIQSATPTFKNRFISAASDSFTFLVSGADSTMMPAPLASTC